MAKSLGCNDCDLGILDLPLELVWKIVDFLDVRDKTTLMLATSRFYRLRNHPRMWKHVFLGSKPYTQSNLKTFFRLAQDELYSLATSRTSLGSWDKFWTLLSHTRVKKVELGHMAFGNPRVETAQFGLFSCLEFLLLDHCNLHDEQVSMIISRSSLESLIIVDCRYHVSMAGSIPRTSTTLKHVEFQRNMIISNHRGIEQSLLFRQIGDAADMTSIKIDCSLRYEFWPRLVSNSPHLRNLVINSSQFGSQCFILVGMAPELESLGIISTTSPVADIVLMTSNLREFELENNQNMTDHHLNNLMCLNPVLEVLNLSGCQQLTIQSLITLPSKCPNIQRLDLGYCRFDVDRLFSELCRVHLNRLDTLVLRGVSLISGTGLIKFLRQYSHQLRHVNVEGAVLALDCIEICRAFVGFTFVY